MNDEGGGVVQRESQKLTRNSKGYVWELKLLKKPEETDEDVLKRMEKLNQEYLDEYGGLS